MAFLVFTIISTFLGQAMVRDVVPPPKFDKMSTIAVMYLKNDLKS